jgi:hypothetical protein
MGGEGPDVLLWGEWEVEDVEWGWRVSEWNGMEH